MTALIGLAGGMVVVGAMLLVAELTRSAPAADPRQHWNWRPSRAQQRRGMLAGGIGLAVLAISRWPVAGIGAVLAVLFLPRIMSTRGARQRVAVLDALEQWVRRVCDLLTASRGLEDALEASARSAPAAIAPAVDRLAHRLAGRSGTEGALRAFADELDDPVGDRIAAALIIATGRRGGGVRDVLSSLATLLSKDVALRREIEAERAQHRTTVKWLVGFVLGFTAFAIIDRSYSAPYGTSEGELVLAVVVAMYATGLAWLERLGSVPVADRFLTGAGRDGGARPR